MVTLLNGILPLLPSALHSVAVQRADRVQSVAAEAVRVSHVALHPAVARLALGEPSGTPRELSGED